MNSFLPQSTPQGPQSCLLLTRMEEQGKTGERGGGQKQAGSEDPAGPATLKMAAGSGEVPQRRYQRMRSAKSRPGTQDGGSGAGEGEAEAAKRAAEHNV